MANPEHYAILKQGVEVWNRWRRENPDIVPDIRSANLTYKNLTIHLDRVNLVGGRLLRTPLYAPPARCGSPAGAARSTASAAWTGRAG
jgi:hypothetical protein